MKKILLLLLLASQVAVYGQFPELAKTPPMGWNSYNTYGIDINSKIVKSMADAIATNGMKEAGYEYIVIDDGWQIGRDTDGKIIANPDRFPEGIKYVADYIHSKGLKFGIYTDMGTKTCGGLPGSLGYEKIDAQTYADWGVDFIKADWCNTDGLDTRTQYNILSDAIRATGRPMILSICEWGVSSPWEWGKGIGAMWRTTNDIQDCYDCVRNWGGAGWVPIMEKNVNLAPFAGPGHWNDPDMLEVGNKSMNSVECRSHFSMWCMLAAPLIAGNNITAMNDTIRDILTAPEIIAIDQDPLGIQGTRIKSENGLQVWQKPLIDGSIAVALLNVTKSSAQISVTLEELGLKKGVNSTVRDLWNRKDLASIKDMYKTEVKAHGVVVIKVKGKKAPVSMLKFNQESIELNKGNHTMVQYTVYPSVTSVSVSSSDEDVASLTLVGVNTYKLLAKKEGTCSLKAVTADGKFSTTCKIQVLPSNIPAPWKLNDVNDDKASATFNNGVYLIEGGGRDIWGGTDQFAFVNRESGGDSSISARIVSQSNSDPWAKSGLMFRESTAPNSKFIMVSVTPVNGISMQWRETTGGTCSKKDFRSVALPFYFKLSRTGSTFSAYKSSDGNQWDLLGSITLKESFPDKYLAGMEVCSHISQVLNISKFDQVVVKPTEK